MTQEQFDWYFPPEDPGYAFLRYCNSLATITQLDNGEWRWEIHQPAQIIVDMDGWWGISKTARDAISEVEKKL